MEEEEEVVLGQEVHRHEEWGNDDKDINRNDERIIKELAVLPQDKNTDNNSDTSHGIISCTENDDDRDDRVEKELAIISQQHNNNNPQEFVLDSRDDKTERNNVSNESDTKESGHTKLLKSEVKIPEKKNILKPARKAHLTSLPPLVPLNKSDISEISSFSLLTTFKVEVGIKDPDTLHRNCFEAVNILKENHALDKYVISEDEAAVLCAIPMLLTNEESEERDLITNLIESCTEEIPNKFIVMVLTALRKLPRYKGVMYINYRRREKIKRHKGDTIQLSFCVASKKMNEIKDADINSRSEVFRVEDGWGYDISDFVVRRGENGRYVPSDLGKLIIIEPWRTFEVMDPGIQRPEEKVSIVPLKMEESELIYEKEIIPNVSTHVVKGIREGIDDLHTVKRMLNILSFHPFNTEYDNRDTFRDAGGIECLIECYEKHKKFIEKEIIYCIANAAKNEASAYIIFNKGFIKTITEITFADINNEILCLDSSFIFFFAIKTFKFVVEINTFFSDIKRFELILALLTTYHSNDEICVNVLYVLNIILISAKDMEMPEEELEELFKSSVIETVGSIMEKTKSESVVDKCNNIFNSIQEKGYDKWIDFDIKWYVDSLKSKNPITHSVNNSLETSEERNINLSIKLSINNELTTYDDILAALNEIGLNKPMDIVNECKEVVKSRWNVIRNGCILSEEEAVLITSYTYQKKDTPEMSPYRILNKKLRENDIQDQISSSKSYLRLLLRALRKLPRIKSQTLYRGIIDDRGKYTVGEELPWNGFSSTSTSMEVIQDFLNSNNTRKTCGTLFEIRGMWGYDISKFSRFRKEQEVLLEPMMKFVVKSIIEQENFIIVVLEPLSNSLFLEDEIPPGCIQHIILNLMNNIESKEICAKMCDILCNVYMNDDDSPDSRMLFKEYDGTKLLCELFEEYKDLNILNALIHVIDPRDSIANNEYDFFKDKGIIVPNKLKIFKGLTTIANRFTENKSICLKTMEIVFCYSTQYGVGGKFYLETGLVDSVVKIINNHSNDISICEIGCKVLSKLIPKETCDEYIKQANVKNFIRILLNIINNHINSAEICSNACDALKSLINDNKYNQEIAWELGGIEIILNTLRKHIANASVCTYACNAFIGLIDDDKGYQLKAVEIGGIETMLNVINMHIDNEHICVYCCKIIHDIIDKNKESQKRMVQANGIEIVLGVMDKHSDNYIVCSYVCGILTSLTINNSDNQEKVKVMNGIDNILRVMNTYIDHYMLCFAECYLLTFFLNANSSVQKYAYEKGYVDTLLSILSIHKDNEDENVCEMCCRVLSIIFSSNKLHSEFYTKDVLNAVRECKEKLNSSNEVSQSLLSLIREEDPRVKDAVSRGVCTGEAFPKCNYDCESDRNAYCPDCCVQQKVFRCFTCDKEEIKVYCETCWKRDHQGHKGEEFFYPTRCATKQQTHNYFKFDFSPDLSGSSKWIKYNRK